MPETSIIAAIVRQAEKHGAAHGRRPLLVKGIGDDCAILRPEPGDDLVFTSDFLLQDRHFTLATHTAADAGHKALARSLSDLAAMGAKPVFYLVSLALPDSLGPLWIRGFYSGLLRLAKRHKITLAGGDLASAEKVTADVICCGSVARGRAMLRSNAKPGDLIYVTGKLGGAAYALRNGPGKGHWRRHIRPEPRIAEGLELLKAGVITCMDLSDGLSLDLHRLCLSSRVSAELDDNIPIASQASLDDALHGGDDYELLFTAPPSFHIDAKLQNTRALRIGTITKGKAGSVRMHGRPLKPAGFQHFT